MKKGIFILALICSSTLLAQSSFGVTAGLNYADNGKVEFSDVTDAGNDIFKAKAKRKSGFHFGVFYREEIGRFSLRPELIYLQSNSSYQYKNEKKDFEINSLELPILVGMKVFGPLQVFVGPSFKYILENDFEGVTLKELKNEFTIGAQFGVGVKLGGIGVDVRYEQALSETHANLVGFDNDRLDSRPNQFLINLSLDL